MKLNVFVELVLMEIIVKDKVKDLKQLFILYDFCLGLLGSCSTSHCLNGGTCQQWDIGTSRYVFCLCQPGWAGSRCDKRNQIIFQYLYLI
jgi:hypothetical protein